MRRAGGFPVHWEAWAPVGNFRGLDFEVFSNLLCVVAPISQPN